MVQFGSQIVTLSYFFL